MMRQFGKLLFRHFPRDQQKRRMDMLTITLLVALVVGGMVAVTILLMNKR